MFNLHSYRNQFKQDIIDTDDPGIIVQKYLIEGPIIFFKSNKNEEYMFKKEFADCLRVHIRDIAIIGSAKLGFSLKPDMVTNKYNFSAFSEDSDIDIAIISSDLFDFQLFSMYRFTNGYSKIFDHFDTDDDLNTLARYMIKGWLRPDKLPKRYYINYDFNALRDNYRKTYNRKFNIGIYKSWYYFESYHKSNIMKIKTNLLHGG